MTAKELLAKVKRTIKRYRMLAPEERVLVAVSGGVDSLVLLHVLRELGEELRIKLAVAHLDHRIRDAESQADAAFVAQQARELGLPLISEARDVPAYAREKKLSLEEAAREVRYRFLEEAAERFGADKIALGHHRDDLAETVLINLIRGAGITGLRGMAPVRDRYIRPLIECSRAEIEEFARERGLQPRLDRTNLEREYLRNRVRLELLPLLEGYRPNIAARLAQTGLVLGEIADFLEGQARERLLHLIVREGPEELVLDRERLLAEEPALRAFILREAVRRVRGSLRDLEFEHLQQMRELSERPEPHGEIHLPGGLRFRRQGQELQLLSAAALQHLGPQEGEQEPEFEFELHPGENVLPEIGWRFLIEELELPAGYKPEELRTRADRLQELIDRDRIRLPLYVRNWRPGDRFRPLGLRGRKKLQDLFVDERIPARERKCIPLICDRNGIIWVVGLRLSEDYKITEKTRRALRITAERLEEDD